ncbi:MAG: DUF4252 domain-containing protein [Bacteroidales bacterium]
MLILKQAARTFAIIFLFLLAACNCTEEETETTDDICQSYTDKGVATFFSVPPGMASVFIDEEKTGNSELKALLNETDHLNFLIIPNSYNVKENVHLSDINQRLNAINFIDLASINSGQEIVTVKISKSKSDSIVDEMVVLVADYETLFCVSFKGTISLNNVANLTKPENLDAMSNLNRFKK